MSNTSSIVWFRQDLRVHDNPALLEAVTAGGPVVPVFIWAPDEEGTWLPGSASRWWLHQSLIRLDSSLRSLGSRLTLRQGPTARVLKQLVNETGAGAVYWNRRYEPSVIERDTRIKYALESDGVHAQSFNSALLFEPWEIQTKQRKPYQVFTPFYKACLAGPAIPAPLAAPSEMALPKPSPESDHLDDFGLEPSIEWTSGIRKTWTPGEAGAGDELKRFLGEAIEDYPVGRDLPSLRGTSRLSPHLHFGEISPRAIWHAVKNGSASERGQALEAGECYLRELVWREFAHHLLYYFPRTTDRPLREKFMEFPWKDDAEALQAWQRGRTGYPIVDAGMRELWETGWMHNRVRMIVASFLVKHLLVPWQEGARWFWDTLVDADLANNTMGWQWTAGCGADAAPYFRIFNPMLQSKKFDQDGAYIRRWIPELSRLTGKWIHQPWEAPDAVLSDAGLRLGSDYPYPVVNHSEARKRALAAFEMIKS